MARQNRSNKKYNRQSAEDKAERFKVMRRNFWHCKHWFSPAYNPQPSPVYEMMGKIQLRSNELEMEYVKARIELEGPESKKWPGADWVEESKTDQRARATHRANAEGGSLGDSSQHRTCI